MTPESIGWGLAASFLLPLAIGMVCQLLTVDRQLAASIALTGGFVVSISLLMAGGSREYFRWLAPREALDWLPVLIVLLTAVGSAQAPGKLSNFMWLVGVLLCVGCGFRLLYGSVYLRPANIQPIPLSVIGAWGLLMAISWSVSTRAQPQRNSRFDWATKVIFVMMLGVAAAMLAMSGSLTYGVVGGLVALATVACLMTSGHLPPGSFVLAQCMIGLGHAFAELPLPAAVGTCLAVCACALCLQVASMRLRWAMLCLSILLMGVCGQLVTRQFLSSLQAKPESNGYEAYK